jgi:hypothetical protein
MAVNRAAPTPFYYEYLCNWAFVDPAGALPLPVQQLNAQPLRIPSFQRGISWGEEEILKLLRSDSVLFGNVVIGNDANNVGVLVDGLQRFAVGTALLDVLYPRVLSPTPSNQLAAPHFVRLRALVANRQPVFAHNHSILQTHPRIAIQQQYDEMYSELKQAMDTWLTPASAPEYGALLSACLLDKQVAVDTYNGFRSVVDLANTFIGLNTVRVDLGTVDLIRSYIVDRATSVATPWTPATIAQVENAVTDTFVTPQGNERKDLLPTGTVVLKCLQSRAQLTPTLVFPSWSTFPSSDVDRFLSFVDQLRASQNAYLQEIAATGGLPLAITLLFYYRSFLSTGALPQLVGTGTADDIDLHRFLRAMYRNIIAGRIGRIGDSAEDVLRGNYTTFADVANALNPPGCGTLDQDPPTSWVQTNLGVMDAKRARHVFNACLLPLRTNPGAAFQPATYSRTGWQVDHLIPSKNLQRNQPGFREGHTLRNFAPLPARFNRRASNTPCSQKLNANGMYDICLQTPTDGHPYMTWLVQNQGALAAALDSQALLEPNAAPAIGDARVSALAQMLGPRL